MPATSGQSPSLLEGAFDHRGGKALLEKPFALVIADMNPFALLTETYPLEKVRRQSHRLCEKV